MHVKKVEDVKKTYISRVVATIFKWISVVMIITMLIAWGHGLETLWLISMIIMWTSWIIAYFAYTYDQAYNKIY